MPAQDTTVKVTEFLGLRNRLPPDEEPLGALAVAENVDVDDRQAVTQREGYLMALPLAGATDLFSPVSVDGLYVVVAGNLYSIEDDLSPRLLASGLTDTVFHWAEFGDRVAFAGERDAGLIVARSRLYPLRIPVPPPPWAEVQGGPLPPGQYQIVSVYVHQETGMMGGTSLISVVTTRTPSTLVIHGLTPPAGYQTDVYLTPFNGSSLYFVGTADADALTVMEDALTHPLPPEHLLANPLPWSITALTFFGGALCAATYDAQYDLGTVWLSQPFAPALFDMTRDYLTVPGAILALMGVPEGLLIGTASALYLYTPDGTMEEIAPFGLVPGRPIARTRRNEVVLWTVRGAHRFAPLAPLHGGASLVPGTWATTGIIERRGRQHLVAITDGGGAAFDPYEP